MRSNLILYLFFYIDRFLFYLMCFLEFCGERLMKICNWVLFFKYLCRWLLFVVYSVISYMYYSNFDVRNRVCMLIFYLDYVFVIL